MQHSIKKTLIIISLVIVIALIHFFRLGQLFEGKAYDFYYSYFSDFILPFTGYFLLTLNEVSIPVMRHWYVKAGIIFLTATIAEVCQYFGVEVLGSTFDPVDILTYGCGVLSAAFIDKKILSKQFSF
jgi:hypothetical protein